MTTLIISKKSDGTLIGRCDAKCYNAKGAKCVCICGGVNHHQGRNQAIDNTRQYSDWSTDAQAAGEFIISPGQLTLFQEEKP